MKWKAHLRWIALAVLTLAIHTVLRRRFPAFNPPYSGKPAWIRTGLKAELAIHILFLGAVITAIWNRIPDLRSPSYSDDGTLSIGSSKPSIQSGIQWGEIALVVLEFAAYLASWGLLYGII